MLAVVTFRGVPSRPCSNTSSSSTWDTRQIYACHCKTAACCTAACLHIAHDAVVSCQVLQRNSCYTGGMQHTQCMPQGPRCPGPKASCCMVIQSKSRVQHAGSLWRHGLLQRWPAAAAAHRMMQTPVAPNSGTQIQLLPATPAAQPPGHNPSHHGPPLQRPCCSNKGCVYGAAADHNNLRASKHASKAGGQQCIQQMS